ncbi:MAG: phosphonate degradation HD-domain oxygenase [Rhodospirillales bacterium]
MKISTDAIDNLLALMQKGADTAYSGERVSQLEHALQCALFAQESGASPALIAASLLHDIGHVLMGGEGEAMAAGIDQQHEQCGADYLAQWFGPTLVEPMRLHVAAKRYLCASDADYFARLSPVSVRSLELQGGPMSQAEAAQFAADPYAQDAVRLRHWDEQGKVVGLATQDLAHFRPLLQSLRIR